jgi:hypothetical protein
MAKPNPILNYRITDHAKQEMDRRHVSEADVAIVLATPEQSDFVRTGREVYQSRLDFGEPPRLYLLRVFVDIDREPIEVVTVYRTSKIGKYWRTDS